jgi:hypothetical protein
VSAISYIYQLRLDLSLPASLPATLIQPIAFLMVLFAAGARYAYPGHDGAARVNVNGSLYTPNPLVQARFGDAPRSPVQ